MIKGSIQQLGKKRAVITANIDDNTTFQIIHDLLDTSLEQFIILMHETGIKIHRNTHSYGFGVVYEFSMKSRESGQGYFSMDQLCKKLPDAELLQMDLRNQVSLTARGKMFAQWLVDNGHKAVYFSSDVGGWGDQRDKPTFKMHGDSGSVWTRRLQTGNRDISVNPDQ